MHRFGWPEKSTFSPLTVGEHNTHRDWTKVDQSHQTKFLIKQMDSHYGIEPQERIVPMVNYAKESEENTVWFKGTTPHFFKPNLISL